MKRVDSVPVGCSNDLSLSTRSPEVVPADRPELFVRKLRQCSVVFDFNDASQELKGKQVKAQTLHEMLDYITSQRGVITEQVYPEVVAMVRMARVVTVVQRLVLTCLTLS
jgi:hypothetical protein